MLDITKSTFLIVLFGICLTPHCLYAVEPCARLKVLNKDEACRAPRRPNNAPPSVKCQNEKSILLDVLPEDNEVTGRKNAWGMWMCLGPDITMCSSLQGKSLGAGEICCAVKKAEPSLQCGGENKLVAIDESQSKGKFCFGKKAWYCTDKAINGPKPAVQSVNTQADCIPEQNGAATAKVENSGKDVDNIKSALLSQDVSREIRVFDLLNDPVHKHLSKNHTNLNLLCSKLGAETYVNGSLTTEFVFDNGKNLNGLFLSPDNPQAVSIKEIDGRKSGDVIRSISCKTSLVNKTVERAVTELSKASKKEGIPPELVRVMRNFGFSPDDMDVAQYNSFIQITLKGGKPLSKVEASEREKFIKLLQTLEKRLGRYLYRKENERARFIDAKNEKTSFEIFKDKKLRKQMKAYQDQEIKAKLPMIQGLYQVLLQDLKRMGVNEAVLDEIAGSEKAKLSRILDEYNKIYGEGFGANYAKAGRDVPPTERDQRHSSYIRKILVELKSLNQEVEDHKRGLLLTYAQSIYQDIENIYWGVSWHLHGKTRAEMN
jgi:hypothetical protein